MARDTKGSVMVFRAVMLQSPTQPQVCSVSGVHEPIFLLLLCALLSLALLRHGVLSLGTNPYLQGQGGSQRMGLECRLVEWLAKLNKDETVDSGGRKNRFAVSFLVELASSNGGRD
jgi:hypothetical protein